MYGAAISSTLPPPLLPAIQVSNAPLFLGILTPKKRQNSLNRRSIRRGGLNLRCGSSSSAAMPVEGLLSATSSPSLPQDSLLYSRAFWVSKFLIAWNVEVGNGSCYLYASMNAELVVADCEIQGYDVSIKLEGGDGGLPQHVIEKFPHISDYNPFILPPNLDVESLLKCQLAVAILSSDGECTTATSLQLPGVLDEIFSYSGPLGAVFSSDAVSLYLWAPTAQSVCAFIYKELYSDDSPEIIRLNELNGVWSSKGPREWEGCYYVYEVSVYHPSTLQIEKCIVNDPYARGLSADGRCTLLVNLDSDSLKPEGWDKLADEKPNLLSFADISIYELHIRDFSANDYTVHPDLRGGYLAFTLQDSAGVLHLKRLSSAGITHVHLLPAFQFAGVDDEKQKWKDADSHLLESLPPDSDQQQAHITEIQDEDGYNWGYNPVLWGVPKGSYASNPNGSCRSFEFRKMVQALNRIGLRVVLDVVYNHIHASGPFDDNSVLDKIVPGYYLRRNTDGFIENSTCTNNTASEHIMVERLILDDLLCWALHYKVDGFRFDLMGHLMKHTMVKAKSMLQGLSKQLNGVNGSSVYLYGEGWNFGEVVKNGRGVNASQFNLSGTGIGSFNDRIRDASLGGSPFGHPLQQGFVTGLALEPNGHDHGTKAAVEHMHALSKDHIQVGMAANLRDFVVISFLGQEAKGSEVLTHDGAPVAYALCPVETINYVSAHDNETLFDIVSLKTPADMPLEDRCRMNHVATSIVALSQGIPFFHAGDEMLRSKSLDRDSYNSGDWFNRLDFSYNSNNWGVGLPPRGKNESNWPLIKPRLANPDYKPQKSHIVAAIENFLSFLEIRYSSPLFRLRTANAIQARVKFHNTGPSWTPGVIVMSIEDGYEGVPGLTQMDQCYSYIVVIINARPTDVSFTSPVLRARTLELHPVQMISSDEIVKKSSYDASSGCFKVPARTTSVFVEPRDEESNLFTLKLHHGGTIRNDPIPEYLGGQLSVFDDVEGDGFTIDEMNNLVVDIGIFEENRYFVLAEEHGFHEVVSNREFEDIVVQALNEFREVELYLLDPSDHTHVRPPRTYDDDNYNSSEDETYMCSADDDSDSDSSVCGEWSDKDSDYITDEDGDVGSCSREIKNIESSLPQNQEKQLSYRPAVKVKTNPQVLANLKLKSAVILNQNGDDSDKGSERDEAPDSEAEFESINSSDNDDNQTTLVFNPKDKWKPELRCGMQFSSFKEFKEAVKNWSIANGRPFKFVKNDKQRVKAKCPVTTRRFTCDWQITARNMGDDGTVQIRSFKDKHKCGFRYKNKAVKSDWVAKKYTELFRQNPKLDSKSFREQVMKENRCYISKNQGYRAKRRALKIIQGSEIDQYSLLHAYSAEILNTNPGSTVILKMVDGFCDKETGKPRFERIYICFAGVKEGFLAGCRKLLGLDGTFLKGPCGGILLTAVGIDPNNGLFPVAYAVVEGENTDSWTWFLALLRADLHIESDEEWTLMSDKQKGLIQASDIIFPSADHRFCVKHLHGNWSSAGFKGKALRKALWGAAKATTVAQFMRRMEYLTTLNEDAAKWLEDKPPSQWSRSHFRVDLKCDMLLNNHCESFNGKILEHREKAIVEMLEGLRIYLMERMQENRDRAMLKWTEKAICPKIFKRVQTNCEKACLCVPHKSDDANVEIWCEYGFKYAVNIKERTCTCRKWDLTGIPCAHAISALWTLNAEPMEYVDSFYSVDMYLKCYSYAIFPLSGQHEWVKPSEPPPLPPVYGRAPGRPRKNRRKNALEVIETKEKNKKVTRTGLKGRCTICCEEGHNRRTCKGRTAVDNNDEQSEELRDEQAELQYEQPDPQLHSQLTQEDLQVHIHFGLEDIQEMTTHPVKKQKKSIYSTVNLGQKSSEGLGIPNVAVETCDSQVSLQRESRQTKKVDAVVKLSFNEHSTVVGKRPISRLFGLVPPPTVTSAESQKNNVNVDVEVCDSKVSVRGQTSRTKKVATVNKVSVDAQSSHGGNTSYKDKYELFGLVPPPFPIGSKPNLKNVKNAKPQQHRNASMVEQGIAVEQKNISPDYIAGMRNAYESMGIQLPSIGESNAKGSSVYEVFGIPVPAFLGGNLSSAKK